MLRLKSFPKLLISLLILSFIASCAPDTSSNVAPSNKKLRNTAIHDTALTYGAQAGLAWQSKNIRLICHQHAKQLDQIFNFNALLMKNSLLPPVLAESRDSLRLASNSIRLSDRIIEIIQPARFVSTPPTWRDYIQLTYQFPKHPNTTLLPTTAYERYIWDTSIQKGWQQGITQANNMLNTILGQINRDFSGIALYHALYAQHMVSAPETARAHLGVTGNQKRMRVNDQLIRITSHSNLEYQRPAQWQPAVIGHTTPHHTTSKTKMSYHGRK
jgi:defect in organelle trafficking protein DotC